MNGLHNEEDVMNLV